MTRHRDAPAQTDGGATPPTGRDGETSTEPRHDDWPEKERTWFYAALLLVTVAAGAIRCVGSGQSFGGYHGFNEAFYTLQAVEQMKHSLWEAWVSPSDFFNPPLFTMVLRAAFAVLGVSEAAARSVPVACSMLGVFYLGLLGTALYSSRTGLIAAAIMAVTPAAVLVGRNVQIEALFVLLVLAGAYHH